MKKVGKSTRPFSYDLNQIPYDYTVLVTNIFKGLDLINRVPEELWMEIPDIVQEAVIKTIPKKKKCKKAKWLSEEGLQIAVKRRKAKCKGEKERYKQLNAKFQRIARRDKKAFLSDQCKEIEENNGMGKTRDLFKKIRDTKGTFHASSVQFSRSVVSDSLRPHESQHATSLSITKSRSSPKLMCVKSVMPSSQLILCRPLLLLPQSLPALGYFPMSQFFV